MAMYFYILAIKQTLHTTHFETNTSKFFSWHNQCSLHMQEYENVEYETSIREGD